MQNFKNNKGSVAVVVIVAVLFIMSISLTLYFAAVNRKNESLKQTEIIKSSYEKDVDKMDELYETYTENEKMEKYKKSYSPIIPDGFKFLEGTVDTGYVIQNLTTEDEFVWIPVLDPVASSEAEFTEMVAKGQYPMAVKTSGQDQFGRDNYRGVLYDFDINGTGGAVTVSVKSYDANSGTREPANLTGIDDTTGYVYDSQEMFTYQNAGTWYETMYQEEYNDLVASVIKNCGFWVGRYESGNLSNIAVSKAGASGIGGVTWYKAYISQKNIYGNNSDNKTHMIWGSQFDQVLIYLKDVRNTSSNVTNGKPFYVLNSIDMGVYYNNSSTYWDGTAGKFEVKGIYDIGGNVWDRTMDTYYNSGRIFRGRLL